MTRNFISKIQFQASTLSIAFCGNFVFFVSLNISAGFFNFSSDIVFHVFYCCHLHNTDNAC